MRVTSPYGGRDTPRRPVPAPGWPGCGSGPRCCGGSFEAGAGGGPAHRTARSGGGRRAPLTEGDLHDDPRLVAEDQSAVRAGLVLILGSAPDIEVVGEAADGERRWRWPGSCGPTWC